MIKKKQKKHILYNNAFKPNTSFKISYSVDYIVKNFKFRNKTIIAPD